MVLKGACKILVVFGAILFLAGGGEASATMCLYDDFSGTYINSQKWTALEFVREIRDGGLVSEVGTASSRANNASHPTNYNAFTSIQSDVKLVEIKIESGNNTEGRANINGAFYNSKSSAPSDSTGDITSAICIGDFGSGLSAGWYIAECLDGAWQNWKLIDSGTLVAPGNLTYSAFYTAKIIYDGNTQFTFQIDGYPVVSANGPERQGNAFHHFKTLSTVLESDIALPGRLISAVFDNFYIDEILYDSFDGPKIDPAKWNEREAVRNIADSALQQEVQGYNSMAEIRNQLKFNDASCVSAKVKIRSGTALSPAAQGEFQLGGFFYNDTYAPGSYNQCEGEVWLSTRLQVDENEQIQAVAMAHRSTNTTCTSWSEVFPPHPFSVPISLGTENTLHVELKGNQLIFKCDNETYIHNVSTAMNPPNTSRRDFITRLYLDSGESGYLKSTFDDVYVCCDRVTFVAGDFDGNGSDDLAGLSASGAVWYTTNLSTWTQIPGNLKSLAVGDFNGDGKDDLAGLNSTGLIYYTVNLGTWNQVPGTLENLAVGDFNGDGNDDLAGLNEAGEIYYTTNLSAWTQVPGTISKLVSGDFNNDGHDDLAGLNSTGLIYYTTNLSAWNQVPGTLNDLIVGDFDNNGFDDLAGLNPQGLVYYTTNLASWNQVPGTIADLLSADLNGDGFSDLAGLNSVGQIYYTTNLSSWNQIPGTLANLISGHLNGTAGDDLAGLNASGDVFYTTNLNTWTQIPGKLAPY